MKRCHHQFACLKILALLAGGWAEEAAEATSAAAGEQEPLMASFGDLPTGECWVGDIEVVHPAARGDVGVDAVTSACPCVKILRFPAAWKAGEALRLTVATRIAQPGLVRERLFIDVGQDAPLVVEMVGEALPTSREVVELRCWDLPDVLLQVRQELPLPGLFVAPADLDPTSLLVDARHWLAAAAVHVPSAVRVPPHGLLRAPLLQTVNRPVVLVDEGWGNPETITTCASLRAGTGADVRILDGGVSAWVRNGRPWRGNVADLALFAEITPAAWYAVRGARVWEVVDFSTTPHPDVNLLFPRARRSDTLHCLDEVPSGHAVLAINENGDYGMARKRLAQLPPGTRDAFYLKGGWPAFADFLLNHATQVTPKRVTVGGAGGCHDCP